LAGLSAAYLSQQRNAWQASLMPVFAGGDVRDGGELTWLLSAEE